MVEASDDVSDILSANREENPWLASEDVVARVGMDGSMPAVIDRVTPRSLETFEDGRKEAVRGIAFMGKTRKVVLNATNTRTLAIAFGRDMAGWRGKRVRLYVVKLGRPAFGREYGIRIRPDEPARRTRSDRPRPETPTPKDTTEPPGSD